MAELLKELSNHNERIEERKAALCELQKLIRENTLQVWDEHFKTILLLLLETMGDREVHTHSFQIYNNQMKGEGREKKKLKSLTFILNPLSACDPNAGSAGAEGDSQQAALEV